MLEYREIAVLEERRQALGTAEIGRESEPIAGGWMTFVGAGSWANQACGLGFDGEVTEEQLDRLVDFYVSRGVEPRIEVCPFACPSLIDGLARRGFELREFENVFARQLDSGEDLRSTHPHGWPVDLRIDHVDPNCHEQVHRFADVSTVGFRPEGTPLSGVLEETTVNVVRHPRCDAFLALHADLTSPIGERSATLSKPVEQADDKPPFDDAPTSGSPASGGPTSFNAVADGFVAVGGGAMEVYEEIACLFGASVAIAYRGRGIQLALMIRRLERAVEKGCSLGIIHSAPGISTERNALRLGFFLVYTKVVLAMPGDGLLASP